MKNTDCTLFHWGEKKKIEIKLRNESITLGKCKIHCYPLVGNRIYTKNRFYVKNSISRKFRIPKIILSFQLKIYNTNVYTYIYCIYKPFKLTMQFNLVQVNNFILWFRFSIEIEEVSTVHFMLLNSI